MVGEVSTSLFILCIFFLVTHKVLRKKGGSCSDKPSPTPERSRSFAPAVNGFKMTVWWISYRPAGRSWISQLAERWRPRRIAAVEPAECLYRAVYLKLNYNQRVPSELHQTQYSTPVCLLIGIHLAHHCGCPVTGGL